MAARTDHGLRNEQLFDNYERESFTRAAAMAENEGKTVDLLVVPRIQLYDTLVQAAARLKASRLVPGVSPGVESGELTLKIGHAWEQLPDPRPPVSLAVTRYDHLISSRIFTFNRAPGNF